MCSPAQGQETDCWNREQQSQESKVWTTRPPEEENCMHHPAIPLLYLLQANPHKDLRADVQSGVLQDSHPQK